MLRHIRLDTLQRICTNDFSNVPIFEMWDIYDQPYKETDFFAEMVHFLLAYVPLSDDKRDNPSLSKAYFASQNGIFRYHWPLSESTFRKYWGEYGAAAPFLYVEQFHSSLSFSLDPADEAFASFVDDVFEQRSELRRYLASCRSAIELLTLRLDSRALEGTSFPNFPDSLLPAPISPPPLPNNTHDVLKMFGRRDKRK